jgi:hypothetical protein
LNHEYWLAEVLFVVYKIASGDRHPLLGLPRSKIDRSEQAA